ncbi:multifunctional oxoglutarate decarboxylase/oxoglutarate dehydrogenase thiamine pyrophosphate-binding subunit/dihydrolipoyllysine-residue succinyltransferase subunit, partial [Streptomyces sp. SID10244]|nr:multifunctional oxoglutarate decarboxylase/oxoglutarate dehydrogenase thiamine pyrophosphate-binding subunit/dihydrolipoyllysine-residue succinyltransferase subunit [Streptomyces sp. SID10244]
MSSSISDFGQNTWLVEEMYQQYKKDPTSVDPSWHEFLANYDPSVNGDAETSATAAGNGTTAARDSGTATSGGSAPAAATSPKAAAPATTTKSSSSQNKQVTLDQQPTASTPARKSGPARESTATKAASGQSTASRDGSSRSHNRAKSPVDASATTASEDENKVLRGPAAAIAKNMAASLDVPTATSVRAIPAKLMIDNRIVINNHLARTRGGKISFTHILGYA